MKIGALNNINFGGSLDLRGNELVTDSQKGKTNLKPCRKVIDANDIKSIDMTEQNIVINYKDKFKNEYNNIYLPLKYKIYTDFTKFKDLICFNTVINAYNAAKQGDVHIFLPEFDEII